MLHILNNNIILLAWSEGNILSSSLFHVLYLFGLYDIK